jgi:hypothetical protein
LKTLLLILSNTVYCTVDCKKIEYIKSQKQIIYIIVLKIGKLVLLIFMMFSIFVQSTVRTRMSASKETIVIYSTSEEVKLLFTRIAIQVNESGLTLECCT